MNVLARMRLFLAAVVVVSAAGCGSSSPTESDDSVPEAPQPKLADLAVVDLRGSEVASPGHQLIVAYRYENGGDTIAPAVGEHRAYLASDTVPSASDYLLGTLEPVALGPGAWTEDSVAFTLPGGFTLGEYQLLLQLDATNLLPQKPRRRIARADSAVLVVQDRDLAVARPSLYVTLVPADQSPSGEAYLLIDYLGQATDLMNPDVEPTLSYSIHVSTDDEARRKPTRFARLLHILPVRTLYTKRLSGCLQRRNV